MRQALIPLVLAATLVHGQPSGDPVYEQRFDAPSAAADFRCTDPDAWRLDSGSLWQHAPSDYTPTHRSPHNIALLRSLDLGSFVLEADLMQTGREYGHRDLCVIFAFDDPSRYCYAHLSTAADENAHNVFVVNDAPRTPVTTRRSGGVDWGRDQWRRLRVERDAEAGTVRVLIDGVEVLFSDRVPLRRGLVGLGSFDDEGRFDNLRIWAGDAQQTEAEVFQPFAPRDRGSVRLERAHGLVAVSIDGEEFASYVYRGTPKPYLAPVRGPGGLRMTRAYPMEEVPGEARDHPHHTGLWWAHGDINGVDLWHRGGRLVIRDEPDLAGDTITAKFSLEGDQGPTGVSITEQIRFAESLSGDRLIDFRATLSAPPDRPLVLGDTKEGTMAIRTHPALRLTPDPGAGVPEVTGRAVNSEGLEGPGIWGKRAAWVDYSGTIDGAPVGVAIFDHPDNPRFPTWWHARDYGLVAANPFGTSAFEGGEPGRGRFVVEPGESVTFRYRFVFHRFDAAGSRVADLYRAWAESSERDAAGDR